MYVDDSTVWNMGSSVVKSLLRRSWRKAVRTGVWRRMSKVSRSFVRLCIALPVKFVSKTLVQAIAKVLVELNLLLKPTYRWWILGSKMAWGVSKTAYSWGYKEALSWRNDKAFVTYWGMILDSSRAFGVHSI